MVAARSSIVTKKERTHEIQELNSCVYWNIILETDRLKRGACLIP